MKIKFQEKNFLEMPIFLKKNMIVFLISNFLWNLGRTLPHAILTI